MIFAKFLAKWEAGGGGGTDTIQRILAHIAANDPKRAQWLKVEMKNYKLRDLNSLKNSLLVGGAKTSSKTNRNDLLYAGGFLFGKDSSNVNNTLESFDLGSLPPDEQRRYIESVSSYISELEMYRRSWIFNNSRLYSKPQQNANIGNVTIAQYSGMGLHGIQQLAGTMQYWYLNSYSSNTGNQYQNFGQNELELDWESDTTQIRQRELGIGKLDSDERIWITSGTYHIVDPETGRIIRTLGPGDIHPRFIKGTTFSRGITFIVDPSTISGSVSPDPAKVVGTKGILFINPKYSNGTAFTSDGRAILQGAYSDAQTLLANLKVLRLMHLASTSVAIRYNMTDKQFLERLARDCGKNMYDWFRDFVELIPIYESVNNVRRDNTPQQNAQGNGWERMFTDPTGTYNSTSHINLVEVDLIRRTENLDAIEAFPVSISYDTFKGVKNLDYFVGDTRVNITGGFGVSFTDYQKNMLPEDVRSFLYENGPLTTSVKTWLWDMKIYWEDPFEFTYAMLNSDTFPQDTIASDTPGGQRLIDFDRALRDLVADEYITLADYYKIRATPMDRTFKSTGVDYFVDCTDTIWDAIFGRSGYFPTINPPDGLDGYFGIVGLRFFNKFLTLSSPELQDTDGNIIDYGSAYRILLHPIVEQAMIKELLRRMFSKFGMGIIEIYNQAYSYDGSYTAFLEIAYALYMADPTINDVTVELEDFYNAIQNDYALVYHPNFIRLGMGLSLRDNMRVFRNNIQSAVSEQALRAYRMSNIMTEVHDLLGPYFAYTKGMNAFHTGRDDFNLPWLGTVSDYPTAYKGTRDWLTGNQETIVSDFMKEMQNLIPSSDQIRSIDEIKDMKGRFKLPSATMDFMPRFNEDFRYGNKTVVEIGRSHSWERNKFENSASVIHRRYEDIMQLSLIFRLDDKPLLFMDKAELILTMRKLGLTQNLQTNILNKIGGSGSGFDVIRTMIETDWIPYNDGLPVSIPEVIAKNPILSLPFFPIIAGSNQVNTIIQNLIDQHGHIIGPIGEMTARHFFDTMDDAAYFWNFYYMLASAFWLAPSPALHQTSDGVWRVEKGALLYNTEGPFLYVKDNRAFRRFFDFGTHTISTSDNAYSQTFNPMAITLYEAWAHMPYVLGSFEGGKVRVYPLDIMKDVQYYDPQDDRTYADIIVWHIFNYHIPDVFPKVNFNIYKKLTDTAQQDYIDKVLPEMIIRKIYYGVSRPFSIDNRRGRIKWGSLREWLFNHKNALYTRLSPFAYSEFLDQMDAMVAAYNQHTWNGFLTAGKILFLIWLMFAWGNIMTIVAFIFRWIYSHDD